MVPFSEANYCPIYDELYDAIDANSHHPDFSEIVRENIQGLMAHVILTDIQPR